MSAQTFKVGDRVRITKDVVRINNLTGKVGTVLHDIYPDPQHKVARVRVGDETTWILLENLEHVTPMSPEAKMVWHAMRAGAKRTDRWHFTYQGRTYRARRYEAPFHSLRIEIALPPLAEDAT